MPTLAQFDPDRPHDRLDPYRGWLGLLAHPDSPCGGGGPGSFCSARSYGLDISGTPVPHPRAPGNRTPAAERAAQVLAQKPATTTTPAAATTGSHTFSDDLVEIVKE